jgi:superfamily I DNA/RNA helicase
MINQITTFTREQFDAFIGALKFPPNKFQHAILEGLAFSTDNYVVSALAGSGKTSLIVQAANLLKAMGVPGNDVLIMAFNVKIKEELNKRLPSGYSAMNSHSLGLQICKQGHPKARRDASKWYNLIKEVVDDMGVDRNEEYTTRRKIQALCSKVMLNYVDPSDVEAVAGIAVQYHIEDVDIPIIRAVAKSIRRAREIFEKTGALDFDEMLYLPVVMGLQPPQVKYVFVDEAQDLNVLQQEIASRSCAPEGRMVIVGDAKQAIYHFAGADAASFEKFKTMRPNTKVMPLNICYRCPTSHLELARKLVPDIEARPGAPEGEITFGKKDDLALLAKAGDLVMSRTNAPLLGAYFGLIKSKIPAKVIGREIGKDLSNTLDKIAQLEGFSYSRMVTYIERYREIQAHHLQQQPKSEAKLEEMNDKMDCLSTCVINFTECHSLETLKSSLEALFTDESSEDWRNSVALCSVHRAKGLEADNTFILNPEKMPLIWEKQTPVEFQQELNIKYVALTRALKKLTFISGQEAESVQASLAKALEQENAVAPKFVDMPKPEAAPAIEPVAAIVPPPIIEQPIEILAPTIVVEKTPEGTPYVIGAAIDAPTIFTPTTDGTLVTEPVPVPTPKPVLTLKDSALKQIVDGLTDAEIEKLLALLLAVREERKSA